MERAKLVAESANLLTEPVSKETHSLLRVVFDEAAVARFTTSYTAGDQGFAPLLSKRLYGGPPKEDWKVWYFRSDLDLQAEGVTADLMDII